MYMIMELEAKKLGREDCGPSQLVQVYTIMHVNVMAKPIVQLSYKK